MQTTPITELRKQTTDQLRAYNESLATSGERPNELRNVQKVLAERQRKRKARSTSRKSAQAPAASNKGPGKVAKGKASAKGKRGAGKLHADDAVIRVLATENPKRTGSRAAKEFELYRDGMTVKQYLEAGGSRAGINWDVAREFIKVEAPAKS